ncbi:MAG: hypothetical protein QHH13_05805 [Melioribacter sp.]|uniref:hypothetical protein n=1 Tax=Rosettibacter primus TaxID=3111523 RepID=UPI00247EA36C|nr:hypothetical protein [Melioribacter sp.]
MNEKEIAVNWIEKIRKELKSFPEDFNLSTENKIVELPGKNLFLAPPLFDSYEIVDNEGNIVFHFKSYYVAKYIIYANRNKPSKILIPENEEDIRTAVKSYEDYLDNILRSIEKDCKEKFPEVSSHVFKSLNLIRL